MTLVVASKRWVGGVAWPVALALVLRVAGVPQHSLALALLVWIALGLLVPLVLLSVAWSRVGREEIHGTLTIDPEAVRFDGAPIARASDLASGILAPSARGNPTTVVLRARGARSAIRIVPSKEADAKRILEALELDARHRSVEVRALSGVHGLTPFRRIHAGLALFAALGGIWVSLVVGAPRVLLTGPVVLVFASVWALVVPTRVRIGADGILLTWLVWKRFVRIADITRASRVASIVNEAVKVSVAVVLRSNETLILPIGGAKDEGEALLIAQRIEDAVAAQRARKTSPRANALLRAGRSPLGWVSYLRTIGSGANADMRSAAISKAELFDLVEDASELPSARVGAAMALRSVVNPYERKRIRIAARATASPELGAALEAAADGEASDVELARVLVRVERRRL